MNSVAAWAKQSGLIDYSGAECIPTGASLLEALVHDEPRVELLQRHDGLGPNLTVTEPVFAKTPTTEEIERLLAEVSILRMLSPEEVHTLAITARPLVLGPTERFVVQGKRGNIIVPGRRGRPSRCGCATTTAPTGSSRRWIVGRSSARWLSSPETCGLRPYGRPTSASSTRSTASTTSPCFWLIRSGWTSCRHHGSAVGEATAAHRGTGPRQSVGPEGKDSPQLLRGPCGIGAAAKQRTSLAEEDRVVTAHSRF